MRLATAMLLAAAAASASYAQAPEPEQVGRLEGAAAGVRGATRVERDGGQERVVLLSGSEVSLPAGAARILLTEGGEIEICGPARLTLLKSGRSLTVALDSGSVRARPAAGLEVRIFTALVEAAPVSVGGEPRDASLGLAADGAICVLASRGAVRLAEQLTGAAAIVPELGEVSLPDGRLENMRESRGACACSAATAGISPAPPVPAAKSASHAGKDAPAARDAPVWQVIMPPLAFHAGDARPAEPSLDSLQLVREARVQPAVFFIGKVEDRTPSKPAKPPKPPRAMKAEAQSSHAAVASAGEKKSGAAQSEAPGFPPAASSPSASSEPQAAAPQKSSSGFGARLKGFFRRLFGAKPKDESGGTARTSAVQN